MSGFLFSRLIRYGVMGVALVVLAQFWLNSKSYTFSPKEFRKIAEKHAGKGMEAADLAQLVQDFRRAYYIHILPDSELQWIPISAGGLNGRILLLHASLTEYMALLNFPISTSGNAGIHLANQSCTVLSGKMTRFPTTFWSQPQTRSDVFTPGKNARQYMFETSLLSFEAETNLLCYGRGVVATMGPYMTLNSWLNLDPVSPIRLYFAYIRASAREAISTVQEGMNYLKRKFF